ncbi:hypothetical protein MANI_029898 [Metarhizium anisopliae]|nr:hypothetical protein MANI_029898 [Metarhizium anisopliae]
MNYNDLTWAIFSALVWFAIESVLIFVCGTAPSLRPLYERYIKTRRLRHGSQDSPVRVRSATNVNIRSPTLAAKVASDVVTSIVYDTSSGKGPTLVSVSTDALFGVGQGLAAGFKAVARRGTSEVDRLFEGASKLQRARGTARRSARVPTVKRMEIVVSIVENSAKRRRLSEAEKVFGIKGP